VTRYVLLELRIIPAVLSFDLTTTVGTWERV
jgi:hypothetical protein